MSYFVYRLVFWNHHRSGRLIERILFEEERNVVPTVKKVGIRGSLLVLGAEHGTGVRRGVEIVDQGVRASKHGGDLTFTREIFQHQKSIVAKLLDLRRSQRPRFRSRTIAEHRRYRCVDA